jgi:hypothetical protein
LIVCVLIGAGIPFTPLGALLGFTRPPLKLLITIGVLLMNYLILVEIVKRRLYRRGLN